MVKQPNKQVIVRKKRVRDEVKEKPKKIYSYRNIYCDSLSETYCLMWLFELQDRGYIKNVDRAETYILFNTVTRNYVHKLKTKSRTEVETLHKACQYTPDFQFTITNKGLGLKLFKDINYNGRLKELGKKLLIHQGGEVIIEVKGTIERNENSTEEKWSVVNKWLWDKYGKFCNLWTVDLFFNSTWTPRDYLLTPKTKQPRKLKWKPTDIDTYLKTISK